MTTIFIVFMNLAGAKMVQTSNDCNNEVIKIYFGVEAETRISQASFQIIQVSFKALALPRMNFEQPVTEPEISVLRPQHHHWLYFSPNS